MVKIMSNDDCYRFKPLEKPENLNNPFFAYGIFKNGQLAHSKIKDFVKCIEEDEIYQEMLIRDGIPLIIKDDNDEFLTKGQKIYFISGDEEDAYETISDTLSGNLYKWDTIDIDERQFNILVGITSKGCHRNVDEFRNYIDDFDGECDPFFRKLIKFIDEDMNSIKIDDNYSFRLQMYYMLVWSGIERYCNLKYDAKNKPSNNLKALSKDPLFRDALKNVNLNDKKAIYSAKNSCPFYFNIEKPYFIVNYYYTIRSNVTHRGKGPTNKMSILKDSLMELLSIFEFILDNSFKKETY